MQEMVFQRLYISKFPVGSMPPDPLEGSRFRRYWEVGGGLWYAKCLGPTTSLIRPWVCSTFVNSTVEDWRCTALRPTRIHDWLYNLLQLITKSKRMKISPKKYPPKVRHFVFTVPLFVTSATELTVIIIQFLSKYIYI